MKQKANELLRQEIPVHTAAPDQGLSRDQVEEQIRGGWVNHAPVSAARSKADIILANTLTFFNCIFVILAVWLMMAGSSVKNLMFLVVVICNTVIGICQELRAKRAVDELNLVAQKTVRTVRDGALWSVPQEELVRDDIVVLSAGDQICADGQVCQGQLQVNEALVTGEADAIVKNPGDPLLSGSFVVAGTGRARLTGVGRDAYVSRLAKEAKADPRAAKSEMMRSLDRLIRVIGFLLIPIGALLFYQQYRALQLGMRTATESTVAALVGMIPEGLYFLTSIALAASSLKLARQKVLVQDMNCIETLARVDVLCVDKTGTITENRMEVENVLPLTEDPPEFLESLMTALYADPPDNDTARAIREAFPGESDWECTARIPFSSAYKWCGGVFGDRGAFVAGAPEWILGDRFCEIQEQTEDLYARGYRVLAVARYGGAPEPGALAPDQVTPLALIVLSNRIRPEAPDTFRYFEEQGVTIKVISGDNPAAVSEIARRAGIVGAENWVDARELTDDGALEAAAENATVFGRVTPEQKQKLVQALKRRGHTVAMTGDGVNDVLAMKDADCGIAMASGAHAASQVAKIVLLDSDFGAMPSIVGEGRRVINNIQRAATLFLVKNIFSLALSLLTLLTNWPYPIVPVHLSVISALTIGVPSFFLAMEPNYERVSGRFLTGVMRRAFPGGLTNVFVVLAAQAFMVAFQIPQEQISTVCAAILAFVGLLVLYQVCKPFDRFRRIIWASMAVCLVGCFTLLGEFFTLEAGSAQTGLVMATLLIMTPSVFTAVRWLFDRGGELYRKLRERKNAHADL